MRKCPKCGKEMELIRIDSYRMIKQKVYECQNCGYIERVNEYKQV